VPQSTQPNSHTAKQPHSQTAIIYQGLHKKKKKKTPAPNRNVVIFRHPQPLPPIQPLPQINKQNNQTNNQKMQNQKTRKAHKRKKKKKKKTNSAVVGVIVVDNQSDGQ
jgi:hypothetical protein